MIPHYHSLQGGIVKAVDGPMESCTSEYCQEQVKADKKAAIVVRSIDGNPSTFIAEIDGKEVGRMSVTVLPLIHDMEIKKSFIARGVADALFFYAQGMVKAAKFSEAAALVFEENETMQHYLETHGALEEEKCRVYMLPVQ